MNFINVRAGGQPERQAATYESSSSNTPREPAPPLGSIPETGPAQAQNSENNYTLNNDSVEGITSLLGTTNLNEQEPTPEIAATLRDSNTYTREILNPNYKLHHANDFQPGEVFKVLWSEPMGQYTGGTVGLESYTPKCQDEKVEERVFAKARRFVVVDRRKGHCLCLMIVSYGKRATAKTGVRADEHGIIYTREPQLLPGERKKLGYEPIKVVPAASQHHLEVASRLNYTKVYTVEYNVKVWFIGRVDQNKNHLGLLLDSYNRAHPPLGTSSSTFYPASTATMVTQQPIYPSQQTSTYVTPSYSNTTSYSNPPSTSSYPSATSTSGYSIYVANPTNTGNSAPRSYDASNTTSTYNTTSQPAYGRGYTTNTPSNFQAQYSSSQYAPSRYSSSSQYGSAQDEFSQYDPSQDQSDPRYRNQ